jgi:hypothetical protein
MPMGDTDTRTVTLVDIPLVKRLTEKGIVLDSETSLTRDPHGPKSASLSTLLLQRNLYTLLARSDKQQVVGQFRLKPDDPNAHIVYIAPALQEDAEDTLWLHILDAMAREAGRHSAHCLIAEVDESSMLFETLRAAGFAVYARQEIWRHLPGDYPEPAEDIELADETADDALGVQSLFCNTVPSLVQQVAAPSGDGHGLVYRQDGRVEGYLAISEGKHGVYIIPYLRPEHLSLASPIIHAAIKQSSRAAKAPVYVCVRRYQDWLEGALFDLDFEPWAQRAVMVRHIAAGVRQAVFTPLRDKLEVVTSPVQPPTKYYHRRYKNRSHRVHEGS